MDHEHEAEALRQQMEDTRASLTEKLETLEHQIVETVHGATDAVTATVENVKEAFHDTVSEVRETVHETVDSVKSTLDLSQQVERHPWLMLAGAVAVGFLAERILSRATERRAPVHHPRPVPPPLPRSIPRQPAFTASGTAQTGDGHTARESGAAARAEQKTPTHAANGLTALFGHEIDHLKKMAVGATLNLVRDLVTEAVPPLVKPKLTTILDSVTTKLGGEPTQSSLFTG